MNAQSNQTAEGHPEFTPDAYVDNGYHKSVCKANDSGLAKELEHHRRQYIKLKVVRNGPVKTFQEAYHIPDGHSHLDWLHEYEEMLEQKDFGSKTTAQKTFSLFVTLSPEPGTVEPLVLLADMQRFFNKSHKGFGSIIWCMEQSGTVKQNNLGYHPHVHALIELDKSSQSGQRSKAKDTIVRNFKKYKTKSDAYLDIKPVSEAKHRDKVLYICGMKRDKEKLEKVEADKIWREQLGIDPVYGSSDVDM